MSRNRQVSTTAIARALADASKGDYEDASQTLRLAIKLIKQSKVSDDSRCQVKSKRLILNFGCSLIIFQ